MAWARRIAAIGAVAALAAPVATPAVGGRATGSLSVSAVVVRSTPIALRPAAVQAERAAAAPARPAQPAREIAVSGARGAAGAFPAGAHATVVFVDGAPPAWRFQDRPAAAAATLLARGAVATR